MRDIRYKWNEGPNSVGVSNEVSLPQFKVLGHRQRAMEISLSTGNVTYEKYFQRVCKYIKNFSQYLLQIYCCSKKKNVYIYITILSEEIVNFKLPYLAQKSESF